MTTSMRTIRAKRRIASGEEEFSPYSPIRYSLFALYLVARKEHPDRAVDHPFDLFARGRRCGLENERLKQRRLAHLHELRCGEFAVVDRKLPGFHLRIEVLREAIDGVRQHAVIKAPSNVRHPLGDRHHGADRRSAAWPAQQLNI